MANHEEHKEWNKNTLAILHKRLRIYEEEDISMKLTKYAEMIELFDANFPTWATCVKGEF
jgi:hypothetical protein